MKLRYSNSWNSSIQPRKQRKFRANAPLHTKHKFLSANLSKILRQKHGKRNIPIHKGDEVVVMRGAFKKKKAKIDSVDMKRTRVTLENIQRKKKDGTKVLVYFDPSSLQIQTLNLEDNKRTISLNKTNKTKLESQDKGEKNASDKGTSK